MISHSLHHSSRRSSKLISGLLGLALLAMAAPTVLAQPTDFTEETVISGLQQPIAMGMLPDGRMLLVEKGGAIKIIDPSVSNPTAEVYMTLTNINSGEERGLLDITLDPSFSSNGYFYVIYTPATPELTTVSRFSHLENSGGTTSRGDITSESVLWREKWDGDNGHGAYFSCCHFGGTLDFGPDGKIYVTVGDKFDGQWSQDLTESAGSVIRMNADGTVPNDNPFVDGPGGNDDYIWAYGLRNPFRSRWDVATDRYFISEVGGNVQATSWEDLHLARTTQGGGVNYGWPYCEGPYSNPNLAVHFPLCNTSLYEEPIFSYAHANQTPQAGSIIGGLVYRGGNYPSNYQEAYFYGDYATKKIRYLTFDSQDPTVVTSDNLFYNSPGQIVALEQHPMDGAIYWVNIAQGRLHRIKYDIAAPTITQATATPQNGLAPLLVSFSGAATGGTGSLTYTWYFGDGQSQNGANVNYSYLNNGLYTAFLEVTDGSSTVRSDDIVIEVGTPPTATIDMPSDGAFFVAGETINFSGTGSGNGPLSYEWTVRFGHNAHFHPVLSGYTSTSGSFYVETSGHDYADTTYYQLELEVTDVDGLKGSTTANIYPTKASLTFDTSPSGIPVIVDGIPTATPATFGSLLNFEHTVSVQASFCSAGDLYTFDSWSDGGAIEHVFTTTGAASHTATFVDSGQDCGQLPVTAGLVLRLEGDQGLTESAGNIVSWSDQSTSGNNLDIVGGDPVIGFTPTGMNAAVFDGDQDKLERSSAVMDLPLNNDDRSMFVVVKYEGGNAWGGTAYGAGGQNNAFGLGVVNGGADVGKLFVQAWGSNDLVSQTTGINAGWIVQGAIHETGTVSHFRDGEEIGSGQRTYGTDDGKIVIGEEIGGAGFIDMEVAAVLVYDRPLSVSERLQVETYLQDKYIGILPDPEASITITSPQDGATGLGSDVTVSWAAQQAYPGDHVHLTLDGQMPHITVMDLNGSYTFTGLAPGPHTVQAQVANGDHQTYSNPESSDVVNFTVVGDPVPFAGDLALRLESDAGVMESAGVISSWTDVSGAGNTVMAAGDPVFGLPTPTGEASIALDGVDDKFERNAGVTGLPSGASDRSVFAIIKYDGAPVYGGVAYGSASLNQTFGLGVVGGGPSAGNLLVQGYGGANDQVSSTPGVGEDWLMQSAILVGDSLTHFKDGAVIGAGNHAFNTVIGRIAIGEEIGGSGFIDLDIAAVLIYNRSLNTAERLQVEAYLADKYLNVPTATVTIDSPSQGALITGSDLTILWTGTADAPGDQVELTLDGSPTPVVVPLSGSYTFMGLSDGPHTVDAVVVDAVNTPYSNPQASDAVTVTVQSGDAPFSADLAMHFESTSGVTQNGGDVLSWSDQSVNGNDVTAQGAPSFTGTTPAGQPAIGFDGSDDELRRNDPTGLPLEAADRSMFAVIKYDAVGSKDGGVAYGWKKKKKAFGLGVTNDGPLQGNLMVQGWNDPADLHSNEPGVGAGWLVQSVVVSSNQVSLFKDGVEIANDARTYQTNSRRLAMGAALNGAHIGMEIAAVLLYDRALTPGERATVETYLSNKYLAPPVTSVAITSPVQDEVLSDANVDLAWSSTGAPDDKLLITVDGAPTPIEAPLSAGLQVLGALSNGAHTVAVQIADAAGTPYTNPESMASVDFEVESALFVDDLVLQLESDYGLAAPAGTVTSWKDISAQGNDLTAVGTPTTGTLTPTGRTAIDLDGVSDKLERGSSVLGLPAGATDRSVFAVVKYDGIAAGVGGFSYGTGSANQAFGLGVSAAGAQAGNLVVQSWGPGDQVSDSVGVGAGWILHSAVVSSNVVNHFMNGDQIDSGVQTYNTTVGKIVLGEEISGAGFVDMEVAAVLVYDRALNATERAMVEDALIAKYLESNVPIISVSSPTPDQVIQGGDVTVAWTSAGVSPPDHVHITLDGSPTPIESTDLNGSVELTGLALGAHTIVVELVDGANTPYGNPEASETVNFEISNQNTAPVAIADFGLVGSAGQVQIDVLGNDSDDAGLDSSSVAVVGAAANGTTSVDPVTGVITYTHDGLGSTSDSFTYTVDDVPGLTSNSATVNVSVVDGIVLRYESDYGLAASGQQISSWADQSANGNDLTTAGGPTLTSTPNGRAAVEFDGSDDKAERLASVTGLPAVDADRSIFVVARYRGGSAWGGFAYGNGAPNEAFGLGVVGRGGQKGRLFVQGWGSGNDLVTPPNVFGNWLIQAATVEEDAVTHYRDGSQIDSGTQTYNTVVNRVSMGAEIAGNGYLNMDLAAALVFDRALTNADRQAVEQYLQDKYITVPAPPSAAVASVASVDANAFEELPTEFAMHGNYPNPFRGITRFEFDLPEEAEVTVKVYSLLGREVLSIPPATHGAGAKRGMDVDATGLASGVYLYRLVATTGGEANVATGKFVVTR